MWLLPAERETALSLTLQRKLTSAVGQEPIIILPR